MVGNFFWVGESYGNIILDFLFYVLYSLVVVCIGSKKLIEFRVIMEGFLVDIYVVVGFFRYGEVINLFVIL